MILNEKTQFDVFIKGTEVDLIGLTDEMASNSNWYKWFNDEETTQHMQKHYYPNSESLQIQYLNDDIQGNPKRLQLGILHKADQVFIGVISVKDPDAIAELFIRESIIIFFLSKMLDNFFISLSFVISILYISKFFDLITALLAFLVVAKTLYFFFK